MDVTLGSFDRFNRRHPGLGTARHQFRHPAQRPRTRHDRFGSVRQLDGTQAGHEVIGGFAGTGRQTLQKLTCVFSLDLGTALKFGRTNLTPKVNWDQVYLSEEVFLERPAVGMKLDQKLSDRVSLDFEAKMASDMYSKTSEIPRAEERSGEQWDLALAANFVATPVMRLRGGYTLTGKAVADKRYLYNAYDRHSVNASISYLLGKGMFLLASGIIDFDLYDARDPMIGEGPR